MTADDGEEIIARLLDVIEESFVRTAAQATALKLLCEMCNHQYPHWESVVKDLEERIRPNAVAKFGPLRDMLRGRSEQTPLQLLQVEDWVAVVRRLIDSVGDVDLSEE